jgi:CheY-like chemotaxis protein
MPRSLSRTSNAPDGEAIDLRGVSVLLVDDHVELLELERQLLSELGAAVTTASSADQAIECLRQGAFDVLLSDLGMPGTDGYELIDRIRSTLALDAARLPAAAITAFDHPEKLQRALHRGYQACVLKPVSAVELARTVRSLVARTGAETAAAAVPPPPQGGRRRLRTLFVEDNEYLREQIAWLLEQEGLDVVVCATAEQAEIEFHRGAFDVVMTDVSLPKMSGVDLARRILAAAPDTWVVFVTGYPLADRLAQFGPRVRALDKPFEVADLLRVLEEVHESLKQPA